MYSIVQGWLSLKGKKMGRMDIFFIRYHKVSLCVSDADKSDYSLETKVFNKPGSSVAVKRRRRN